MFKHFVTKFRHCRCLQKCFWNSGLLTKILRKLPERNSELRISTKTFVTCYPYESLTTAQHQLKSHFQTSTKHVTLTFPNETKQRCWCHNVFIHLRWFHYFEIDVLADIFITFLSRLIDTLRNQIYMWWNTQNQKHGLFIKVSSTNM